ncbi:hypothetical protein Bca4012_049017 [Brassica carinata]|uniref:Uncharacterized protein n=1 Tax=Brassica carinata TaxID=52824 RepID=A0A8X7R1Z8_BRACI|nr:hypothetical protein Bca52824_051830 [Brassica carinata]
MPPQKRKHSDKPNHSMISSKVAMVESKIPLSVDKSKLEEPIAAPEVICASDLSAPRKKSRSRSRGRKNAANKGSRVTNSSQNHVPEKHWVPVETQQIPPLVASEVQPEVRYSDQVEEEAEPIADLDEEKRDSAAPDINFKAAVPDGKDTLAFDSESEPEDIELEEEPWQILISKKKKRAQLQEALWRSPAASTAKALRFKVRAQAAALGKRLNL